MNILAIQLGHNATVALLVDGKIVRAVSQEKFDNIKNSSNFPLEAIEWVLQDTNLKKSDIHTIAVASELIFPSMTTAYLFTQKQEVKSENPFKEKLKHIYYLSQLKLFKYKGFRSVFEFIDRNRAFQLARIGEEEFKKKITAFGFPYDKVVKVEHHTCHAYSAFYSLCKDRSKPALIFTLDGAGDFLCATVSVYRNRNIERIAETSFYHSLGSIYSHTTRFLGMKILEHEYKVMGLAPYAKETYAKDLYERFFKPVIWLKKENPLAFDSNIPTNRFIYYLHEKIKNERFDNIAAAVQILVEELVSEWVRSAIRLTGIKEIYTGGGVFMNVKLNKRIMEIPEVEKSYFMPSCGDESNPFGAAFYVYKKRTGKEPVGLDHLYLGPAYSNGEIESFIEKHKLDEKYNIEFYEDIEEIVAQLLADFKVVARFKGRAEWGARALGNRSILANPSDLKSFYEVNDAIKQRDFWMPFAPSILDEDMDRYIINPKKIEAPYMILAFDSTPLAREHLKAAMHQGDKTLRAQIVYKQQNPSYWKLIKQFKNLTGIGGLLNTSLNLHGYPLVATIEQAFFTFENSGLKYMALENWLIKKI